MWNARLDEAQADIKIAGRKISNLKTLMAESEELKSFLMKVKEESEKVGWKLSIQKTKIMASSAAKSLQSCPTLCDPIDGSPPGSAIPGILQARTLEWVAISFSNAWKRKVKVKSLSRVWLLRPHGLQPTRLLRPWIFQARVLEWGAIALSAWHHHFMANRWGNNGNKDFIFLDSKITKDGDCS